MTEIIDISSNEYEDIVSFQNKEIDHFFIIWEKEDFGNGTKEKSDCIKINDQGYKRRVQTLLHTLSSC